MTLRVDAVVYGSLFYSWVLLVLVFGSLHAFITVNALLSKVYLTQPCLYCNRNISINVNMNKSSLFENKNFAIISDQSGF